MNSRQKQVLVWAVTLAVVFVGMAIGGIIYKESRPTVTRKLGENFSMAEKDTDWDTLTSNGITYRRRDDLRTVLLCGVDNADYTTSDYVQSQFNHGGRADTAVLLVVDDTNHTVQALEISRDTMTDVDVYDINDKFLYTDQMQIALQYSFGSSPRRSQWLMSNTVSRLLYNLPVNGNLSLTMDGIEVVVDALGGFTVTMPEDYTMIDPAYTKGAQVTLTGAETARFVRYRDTSQAGSNNQRMERQTWFAKAVYQELSSLSQSRMANLMETAQPYFYTDLDADILYDLATYELIGQVLKLPGEDREGEEHDEYYVDEAALQHLILDLFYEPVE